MNLMFALLAKRPFFDVLKSVQLKKFSLAPLACSLAFLLVTSTIISYAATVRTFR